MIARTVEHDVEQSNNDRRFTRVRCSSLETSRTMIAGSLEYDVEQSNNDRKFNYLVWRQVETTGDNWRQVETGGDNRSVLHKQYRSHFSRLHQRRTLHQQNEG